MKSRTFGLSNLSGLSENSGIYNVRDSELTQGRDRDTLIKRQTTLNSVIKKPVKLIKCTVKFNDNSSYTFEVDVSIKLN